MDAVWGRELSCVVLIAFKNVHSRKVELALILLKTPSDTKIMGHLNF